MSQIAQQDHLLVNVASLLYMTDENKEEIKRLYRAGTLLDTILEYVTSGIPCVAKILGYKVEDGELYIAAIDMESEQYSVVDVGEI